MCYKVEWNEYDPTTGFNWRGKFCDTLLEASNLFHSLKCNADLLVFSKFTGYYIMYAK
jgi:hypothetical protein